MYIGYWLASLLPPYPIFEGACPDLTIYTVKKNTSTISKILRFKCKCKNTFIRNQHHYKVTFTIYHHIIEKFKYLMKCVRQAFTNFSEKGWTVAAAVGRRRRRDRPIRLSTPWSRSPTNRRMAATSQPRRKIPTPRRTAAGVGSWWLPASSAIW